MSHFIRTLLFIILLSIPFSISLPAQESRRRNLASCLARNFWALTNNPRFTRLNLGGTDFWNR